MSITARTFHSSPTRRAVAALGVAAVLITSGAACSTAVDADRTAGPTETVRTPEPSTTDGGLPLSLPAPTGKSPIGTVDLHLVDKSRPDPLVPSKPYRELMVSLWYPTKKPSHRPVAPWISPGAAADWDLHSGPPLGIDPGAAAWATTQTHAQVGAPVDRATGGLPVVVFASGDGGPRWLGTTVIEELASRGYLVVTVDHTYEADQVEFPGGRVERAVPLPAELTEQVIQDLLEKHERARVTDLAFVLDQLNAVDRGRSPDAEGKSLPAGLRGAVDLSRIGMLGQSLGGSAAAQIAHDDNRVDAVVNLDGEFFGPVADTGISTPFLLLASESHTRDNQPTWNSFWAASTGWKRNLSLTGSAHASFTDLQVIFPQLAGVLTAPVTDLIGTIDPERSLAAQRAYLTAFFDLHLRHRTTSLFDKPSDRYPEVRLNP